MKVVKSYLKKKSLGNIETIERDTKALINNLNVSVINETDIREYI